MAALLVAVLAAPAPATAGPRDDLDDAREQLEGVAAELSDLQAKVRRAAEEVADADARLAAAGGELRLLEDDLSAAAEALTTASGRERETAATLMAATSELDATVASWQRTEERLEQRAVDVFKRGSSALPGSVLIGGVSRSHDMHDVAVTFETVDRLLAEDQRLVSASVETARATVAARREVADLRAAAVDAQAAAVAERERVAGLVARQEALVASIDDERARRQDALKDIESDRAQRAALVARLDEQVEAFESRLAATLLAVQADAPFDGPVPDWASRLPAHGRRLAPAIAAAAARAGIDGRLLAAVVWTESNFAPTAVSHAGALGLAQLMPGTAAGLGVDPFDPHQNLVGGARYLRIQIERFGAVDLALAAYNAGPGRVAAVGGAVPDIVETQLYVLKVLEHFHSL